MLKETEIIKEIIDIFSREKMNIQSQCKAGLFDDNRYWENIIRLIGYLRSISQIMRRD